MRITRILPCPHCRAHFQIVIYISEEIHIEKVRGLNEKEALEHWLEGKSKNGNI